VLLYVFVYSTACTAKKSSLSNSPKSLTSFPIMSTSFCQLKVSTIGTRDSRNCSCGTTREV